MGELTLCYTCSVTGERVERTVQGWERARSIARELARASGRRAVIRPRQRSWRMLGVDLQAKRVYELDRGLSDRQVVLWWQQWQPDTTQVVVLPWPSDVPSPEICVA
jgi:hypothetical protein